MSFRCFEFEARFPAESQLCISIKNWNLLGAGGTELIGKTTIDLEDRFYSLCYASCGLPKRFDPDGYNRWRDSILPRQLLIKMCRKFGLKKPIYESGPKLFMFDLNNEKHEVEGNYLSAKKKRLDDESNESESSEISVSSSEETISVDDDDDEILGDDLFVGDGDEDKERRNKRKSSLGVGKSRKRKMKLIRMGPRVDRKLEQLALNALNNWKKYTEVISLKIRNK